jgi:hypothetical protein
MALKPKPGGLATKLGTEVVGETIEGVFGLASATVTAAGEAAKGVGMAVGGALQGALSPAPVTIINSVGMTGGAGKAKVTGGGTIPVGPKKSAKPAVNSKMATEKLLVVAVNYLSSIEKTLVDQLNFERIAAAQQAQAQREAAIESGGSRESASPYKSLGEKLGAIKEAGADKVATATKVILGGAALASLGLLGLGQLDTSELDRLKQNWKEFQDNIQPIVDVVNKVQEFIGDEASLGAAIGFYLAGPKGGLIGLITGLVYDLTGSKELAAAAGGTTALLSYSKRARALAGKGLQTAGRAAYNQAGKAVVNLITNPAARLAAGAAGVAAAATGAVLYGVDQMFKYTAGSTINKVEEFEQSYGLFVQETKDEGGGVFSRVKYKIKINQRKINYFNVPKKEIEGNGHNEKERFYYWNQVHLAATEGRFGAGPAAANWLKTQGPAWLNKRFPIKANATPTAAPTSTPDAAPISSSNNIAGAPTASAEQLQNLPSIPADIEKILATIRTRESGGNYGIPHPIGMPNQTASGAYAFIDESWQGLTKKYGIGTEYPKAYLAPPPIQDAVAAKYVQEILQQAGGDVSKVPLAWYTGNIQGKMSASALATNNGLTPQAYQAKWMADYTGGQYAASSYDSQGAGGGMTSSLADLGKGAMQALGTIAQASFGKQTATTGSQLDGFNDTMKGNASRNEEASAVAAELSKMSSQIQTAVDLGVTDKTQAKTQQESAGAAFGGKADSSNDSKREHFDPNFPGKGSIEKYMQYHKPKMAA